MDLTPEEKLKRFCYIGAIEPVYVHQRLDIDVEKYYEYLQDIIKKLDDLAFAAIIKGPLLETTLPRRDESLFALAVYYHTDMKPCYKANLVKAFPNLIRSDDDLFLFCKQAARIKDHQNRNGFSKTIRKAIVLWYESQSEEQLNYMWTTKRGANGFTHKILFQQFHINDKALANNDAPDKIHDMYFKCSTEVVKNYDAAVAPTTTVTPSPKKAKINSIEVKTNLCNAINVEVNNAIENAVSSEVPAPLIVSISKLRTTLDKEEALKIIRTYDLKYDQVPFRLLRYTIVFEEILPTMSYLQILQFWRYIIRYNHFMNSNIQKLCSKLLDNKELLRKSNIPPVQILMIMHSMGAMFRSAELKCKKLLLGKMPCLRSIYKNSYGYDQSKGFHMHITINLQTFYKNKLLRNHRKLTYFEAAIALAFGYYKRESECMVYHWVPNKWEISKVAWSTNMNIDEATECCNAIQNYKNPQNLMTPVGRSLGDKSRTYDVFLAIVPKSGRSISRNKSEALYTVIEHYRQKRNPKAKFIIVNLMKFKKSMSYNLACNEHILEICGLDEHTVNIIDNFVRERFY